jgi:hypothetical protein
MWNNTAPTASVFSVGPSTWGVNETSSTNIAYLFAEIEGYSKFGTYTGNGAVSGPFVNCGFRPAFILVKRTDAAGNWQIHDCIRDTTNDSLIYTSFPNATGGSGGGEAWDGNRITDILANGFKIRGNGTAEYNGNGGTFFYAAFAEYPFRYANAR